MNVAGLFTSILNGGNSPADQGFVEISGVLNGAIRQGNEVFITPSGRFYGKIEARNVEIAGVAHGDVEAESLVIHSSGQLYYGILKCQHLSVKDGGIMVKKDEKEIDKVKDGAGEGHPLNALDSEYTPGHMVENPVDCKSSNKALNYDDANGQKKQDDIRPINIPQPHYQEAKPPRDETHALKASEQRLPCVKQPHFYSSY